MHGPQFLIDYDLIIVTVNYRLGPLGQLSLDTGLVSGNQVTITHHHPNIRLERDPSQDIRTSNNSL